MDLKDVVSSVYANAAEAHKAFHAGHHEDSERYLMSIMLQVGKYLDEKKLTAAEVVEQVTSETDVESQKETPVEDPGSKAIPASFDAAAAGRAAATGAAEPTPPQ